MIGVRAGISVEQSGRSRARLDRAEPSRLEQAAQHHAAQVQTVQPTSANGNAQGARTSTEHPPERSERRITHRPSPPERPRAEMPSIRAREGQPAVKPFVAPYDATRVESSRHEVDPLVEPYGSNLGSRLPSAAPTPQPFIEPYGADLARQFTPQPPVPEGLVDSYAAELATRFPPHAPEPEAFVSAPAPESIVRPFRESLPDNFVWGGPQPGGLTPELSIEERRQLQELQHRDHTVRAQQRGSDPFAATVADAASYRFERGPDGKMYAVRGDVQANLLGKVAQESVAQAQNPAEAVNAAASMEPNAQLNDAVAQPESDGSVSPNQNLAQAQERARVHHDNDVRVARASQAEAAKPSAEGAVAKVESAAKADAAPAGFKAELTISRAVPAYEDAKAGAAQPKEQNTFRMVACAQCGKVHAPEANTSKPGPIDSAAAASQAAASAGAKPAVEGATPRTRVSDVAPAPTARADRPQNIERAVA